MAGETRVIIEHARLGADPQRRTSKQGKPYMQLSFANTPYRKDRQSGQYENGDTEWWHAVEFDERQMTTYENQLHKGDDIRVEGVLQLSTYTDRSGNVQIDRQVGWARIAKNLPKAKQQGQQQGGYAPQPGGQSGGHYAQSAPPSDPWSDAGGYDPEDPAF